MNQHSGLQIGSYRGAPIYLKASWFIFMILLIVGYGSHLSAWPALTVADGFTAATVVAVTLALGVFLHELAHAVVGAQRGLEVRSISLTVWGGQTSMNTGTPMTSLMVSLVGPLANFLMAGVCQLVWSLTGTADFLGFSIAAQVNVAIGAFNLIPAYPLDGGHALEAAVAHVSRSRSLAMRVTSYTGIAVTALMVGIVVFLGLWNSPVIVVATLALAYFLWSGASGSLKILSQERNPHNPLTAASLMRSVQYFDSEVKIGEVLARWDGRSYLLLNDGSAASPSSVVEPIVLRSALSLANQPLASIASPLAPGYIPGSASSVDIMDAYNGYRYHQLPAHYRQNAPLWAVRDRGATIGVISHKDITEVLLASVKRPPHPA